jgi:hypothetical protein
MDMGARAPNRVLCGNPFRCTRQPFQYSRNVTLNKAKFTVVDKPGYEVVINPRPANHHQGIEAGWYHFQCFTVIKATIQKNHSIAARQRSCYEY